MGLTAFVKKSTEDQQVKGIKKKQKKTSLDCYGHLKEQEAIQSKKKKREG